MPKLQRFRVDVGPFGRYRDLRLLLSASGISAFGSVVTMIAAPLQVARLTHSLWLTGLFGAVQRPSSDALMPRIVGAEDLSAAAALQGIVGNGAFILAPVLGGLLAVASMPGAYALDVSTFVMSLALLSRLRPAPATDPAARPDLAAIAAGLRYALSRRDLLGSYAVDIAAMIFAVPDARFPFLAQQLHATGQLGLQYSAAAVGWGAAVTLAGLMPSLWLIVAFLALAGGADMISGIFGPLCGIRLFPTKYAAGSQASNFSATPPVRRWAVPVPARSERRAGPDLRCGPAGLPAWPRSRLCPPRYRPSASMTTGARTTDAMTIKSQVH